MSTTNLETEPRPVLELSGVAKSFGAVVALASADISLRANSIHALMGENGAGKSTIVKIIAGLYQRDSGSMHLEGQEVDFLSTMEAKSAGIAVIYQEPTLFPDLSVLENIFMGRQPRSRLGRIQQEKMRTEANAVFGRLGVHIDVDRVAQGLSIADQQIIEIAKALSLDAKVLIMDEPTAALSGVEVDRLFSIARTLRDEGRALLFISHRFEEVFALCDTVTVMRDGVYISTSSIGDVTVQDIVRQMVGRNIESLFPKLEAEPGDILLEVSELTAAGRFESISFTARSGEIVCLAGLVGSGRSEVARAVFGIDDYESGRIAVRGRLVLKNSPSAAMASGLALVPEDRRKQGLVMGSSIAHNITLVTRNALAKFGILTSLTENRTAADWAARLEVKASALDVQVATLSGGNQQKVVLAKWLSTRPDVLIVDEPTRGIDIGTKSEVHRLLSELAASGVAIVMISSEMPEVLGMADRIYVMREGRITREISRDDATPESVMFAATHSEVA